METLPTRQSFSILYLCSSPAIILGNLKEQYTLFQGLSLEILPVFTRSVLSILKTSYRQVLSVSIWNKQESSNTETAYEVNWSCSVKRMGTSSQTKVHDKLWLKFMKWNSWQVTHHELSSCSWMFMEVHEWILFWIGCFCSIKMFT